MGEPQGHKFVCQQISAEFSVDLAFNCYRVCNVVPVTATLIKNRLLGAASLLKGKLPLQNPVSQNKIASLLQAKLYE